MNGTDNLVDKLFKKAPFAGVFILAVLAFFLDLGNREPLAYDYRHAVILRTLLREGFSWIPTLLDVPYAQKPPLYFWLLYPLGKYFHSFSVPVLVFPAALSAVGMVCLIYFFLRRLNLQWAIFSTLILITLYPFYFKARMSSVDMLFAFWLTLSVIGFFYFYIDRLRWGGVGLLLGLVGGWLTKGPIGILLPSAIITLYLLLRRDWKNFFRYGFMLGALFLICFAGWYGLCYQLLGKEFVLFALKSHVYGRISEPSNESIFYYLFVVLVMGLPWSFPLVGILREKIKRENKELFSSKMVELERFVFVWFSVIFLLFTFVSVKHLRYIIPIFPPMAILAASFFAGRNERDSWKQFFWKTVSFLSWGVFILIVLAMGSWFSFSQTAVLAAPLKRYLIVGIVLFFFIGIEFFRLKKRKKFGWASLIAALFCVQFFHAQFVLPTISYAKSPKEIVLQFEKVNQRQNPLGFYQFNRDDLFRYMYYSWRFVFPMILLESEKIVPTMKFMKYKRGYFVTYRKRYDALPDTIKKECVIEQEIPFRDQIWVNAKWRDPEYP